MISGGGSEAEGPRARLKLLGHFDARGPDGSAVRLNLKKARIALAALALATDGRIGREELMALLWSDRSEGQARQSGRQTLAAIRRAFREVGCDVIDADLDTIVLASDAVDIDAVRFRTLLAAGDTESLRSAVALYTGPLLEGLAVHDPEAEDWLASRRAELQAAALRAMETLLAAYTRTGAFDDLEALGRRALEIDPLLEEAHRALITAHLARGQHALATRQFRYLRELLARELQTAPSPETIALMKAGAPAAIEPGRLAKQDDALGVRARAALPKHLASFVGRVEERAEVIARLERFRLVTLVGSGGAGKTRLSIQVGSDLQERFGDEVWFVELAALDDPQLVAETVCGTLGVPAHGGRSAIDTAVDFLSDREALLILDNCEHLIEAVAATAEALVRACPKIWVLATSREPLAIAGEGTFRVPNLAYPPAEGITAREAQSYSAVRLLIERASALVERFELTDDNAPAVASICRQVDGIPLALELAAPRLRAMAPEQLASQLRDMFSILTSGSRTVLPRHQTLTNLFDWSYGLLTPDEQVLLTRLSVFADGWRLEAAEWVAGGAPLATGRAVDLLTSLVDKSLVVADFSGAEPRYKLLETTRQYALSKLRERGERGRRRLLTQYLISFFAEAEARWPTTSTLAWLRRYEPELDNLRAALEWSFGPNGDANLGVELTGYATRLWNELSLLSERGRWVTTAFERLDEGRFPDAAARLWLGRTSVSAHGDRSSAPAAEKAVQLFASIGHPLGQGEALAKLGAAMLTPETTAESRLHLDQAGRYLEPAGPTKQLADWYRSLAVSAYFTGDFVNARSWINRSLALAEDLDDTRGIVSAQIALAELELTAGNVEAAVLAGREVLEGGRANRRQVVLGLGNLTSYLLAADQVDEATAVARDALREARALGWPAAVVRILEHIALIAALSGKIELAARLMGFGTAFYAAGTASREYTEQITYDRVMDLVRDLPEDRREFLLAEGRDWRERQAVAAATDLLTEPT
jgi:predicted ATPase/DNA-binding SARP family transcriptional activator